MNLLDCLYHENTTELVETVSELMDHLHPYESMSTISSELSDINPLYISECHTDETSGLVVSTTLDYEDDLARQYYKEPDEGEEIEEKEIQENKQI